MLQIQTSAFYQTLPLSAFCPCLTQPSLPRGKVEFQRRWNYKNYWAPTFVSGPVFFQWLEKIHTIHTALLASNNGCSRILNNHAGTLYVTILHICTVRGTCVPATKNAFWSHGMLLAVFLGHRTAFRCVPPYFNPCSPVYRRPLWTSHNLICICIVYQILRYILYNCACA